MSKPQINVTPLIDVLLVLLIIFMVVTPMKPSSLDARIPSEPDLDRSVMPDPRTIVVTVGTDSSLRLNHSPSGSVDDPGSLIATLVGIFAERTQNLSYAQSGNPDGTPRIEKTVFIKAPKNIDYGTVARVVDALKQAGASPVTLQIDDLD
ncbi:MAG TPA: biopolymer transporter ExbD [Pyrinomonadaceae bacterium]|nr:biopolymer transporter ExbD [Pyrinomonadaceae bacterium]